MRPPSSSKPRSPTTDAIQSVGPAHAAQALLPRTTPSPRLASPGRGLLRRPGADGAEAPVAVAACGGAPDQGTQAELEPDVPVVHADDVAHGLVGGAGSAWRSGATTGGLRHVARRAAAGGVLRSGRGSPRPGVAAAAGRREESSNRRGGVESDR